MNKYKSILIALSLLSFAACGSSGGGSNNVKPSISPETTKLINSEITKNKSPMIETTGKTISNTKNDIITLTKDNYPTTKDKDGKVDATYYAGEVATGQDSIIINNGTITSNGINVENEDGTGTYDRGIGMLAGDGGKLINNGKITGRLAIGMTAIGTESNAVNRGVIENLSGKEDYKTTDEGVLYDVKSENSYGISARDGATAVNDKSGKILGGMVEGMNATGSDSKIINYGEITLTSPKYLEVYNDKNDVKQKSQDSEYYGMYVKGISEFDLANGTNQNKIELNGKNGDGIGMYGKSSTLLNGNEGTILGNNLSIGMMGEESSNIENDGKIIITKGNSEVENYSIGMLVDQTSKAVNNRTINLNIKSDEKLINIDEKLAVGMAMSIEEENGNWDQNNGMVNNEKIILKDNSIGMGIENESNHLQGEERVATNNGDIYLNGHDSIGMYASGSQTKIINGEKGTIYLSGINLNGNNNINAIIDPTQDASGVNEFGKDNYGNIAMKIENGATMVNKGKIIFEGK